MQDKILLFIPAYNCQEQIVRVLSQLTKEVVTFLDTVIIVNNRSTDATEHKAADYIRSMQNIRVKVLRNHSNYGLGGSHKVAFKYAMTNGFTHIIVLHGDDQGDISNLLPLLHARMHHKHDCLLGARFCKGSKLEGYSKFRTLGNHVYNILFSSLLGKRIYDLGSGLNMYTTKMLSNEFYMKFPDDLTFNYCMCIASAFYRHDCHFFPITWREEDQISNVKLVSQAKKVLNLLFSYSYNKGKFIGSELRTRIFDAYHGEIIAENV